MKKDKIEANNREHYCVVSNASHPLNTITLFFVNSRQSLYYPHCYLLGIWEEVFYIKGRSMSERAAAAHSIPGPASSAAATAVVAGGYPTLRLCAAAPTTAGGGRPAAAGGA